MKPILFAIKRGRQVAYPAIIGIKRDQKVYKQVLFDNSNTKCISDIRIDQSKIKTLFDHAVSTRCAIVTNDRASLIAAMGYSNRAIADNIFDHNEIIHETSALDEFLASTDASVQEPYKKLLFDAGCVYDKLSDLPIYVNYTPLKSSWSHDTFTGRSKCTGFNIQGYNMPDFITRDGSFEDKVLLHFDWICADLRIASVVSGDDELESAFRHGDPYEYLFDRAGNMFTDRKDSKIALLKAINSLNFDSGIFDICYGDLKTWLIDCAHKLTEDVPLETLLGRKFVIPKEKTILSGINGVLQGSIAHAMQNTITKVNALFPRHIICDIHDSLVMSCENDRSSIQYMINSVKSIMSKPLDGLIDRDIYFPLRYGIGKKWREYKYSNIQREHEQQETAEDTSES